MEQVEQVYPIQSHRATNWDNLYNLYNPYSIFLYFSSFFDNKGKYPSKNKKNLVVGFIWRLNAIVECVMKYLNPKGNTLNYVRNVGIRF